MSNLLRTVLRRNRKHITRKHVERQRLVAVLMIGTGLLRVTIWGVLVVLYLAHVKFARDLYASVSFVALLSVVALLLTDWGQVAASLAQLTAGDVHHSVKRAQDEMEEDVEMLERDIARLAELAPGKEGHELADSICERLPKKD